MAHSLEGAPLESHRVTLAATDFFTVEVARPTGLVTYYVLFFIEFLSRRVDIAGVTPNPDERFMLQIARNVTDPFDGFLRSKKYLSLDRDPKFTTLFQDFLSDAGTKIIRLPIRSPILSAYAERFVLCVKSVV